MGKNKKPQKTKELSVAIAEASSMGDLETQQQPQTPRKRGRPRKIIEKIESELKREESIAEGAQATHEQVIGSQSKKIKTSQEEEEEQQHHQQQQQQVEAEGPSSSMRGKKKEEEKSEAREPPRRSRRRKSKPRKSS